MPLLLCTLLAPALRADEAPLGRGAAALQEFLRPVLERRELLPSELRAAAWDGADASSAAELGAAAALEDPLQSLSRIEAVADQLLEALAPVGRLPSASAIHALRDRTELGRSDLSESCSALLQAARTGLIDQSLLADRENGRSWTRREERQLRAQLDVRIDAALGELLSRAGVSACEVELARQTLRGDPRVEGSVDRGAAALAAWQTIQAGLRPGSAAFEDAASSLAGLEAERSRMLVAGRHLDEAVLDAAVTLSALPAEVWPESPIILTTPLGPVWIGTPSNNSGTGDPFLLMDPGGDDHWRISPERDGLPPEGLRPVRIWIDLGGDDLWQSGDGGAGGALFSVSSGLDLRGDDTHRAGALTQGAAFLGAATWLDLAGSDIYVGEELAQGAALLGSGALLDAGGDDRYEAKDLAQAAALPGSLAVLQDTEGNDHYRVEGRGQGASLGFPGLAAGGTAWHQDDGGNDHRIAGGLAQAACVAGGMAVALDRKGDDHWLASRGGIGAASRGCAAFLVEGAGDDSFRAGHGLGHAESGALSLIDERAGTDHYHSVSTAPAQASTGALSIVVDRGGTGSWTAAPPGRPGGPWTVSILEGDGVDSIREEEPPEGEGDEGPGETAQPGTSPAEPLEVLRQAGSLDEQTAAELLIATLGERPPGPLLPVLVPSLSSRRFAEPRALLPLLRHWATQDAQAVAEPLAALMDEGGGLDAYQATTVLGALTELLPDNPAVLGPAVAALGASEAWTEGSVREAAFRLRRFVLDDPSVSLDNEEAGRWQALAVRALAEEQSPATRLAAIQLLEQVGGAGVASALAGALRGGGAAERVASEAALTSLCRAREGLAVARSLFPLTEAGAGVSTPARSAALRVLGQSGHREAWEVLDEALADPSPQIRIAAIAGARSLRDPRLARTMEGLRGTESDPGVLEALSAP